MKYDIHFPKRTVTVEGTSHYVANFKPGSLEHLATVADRLLLRLERPVVLDIGANIGLTTLLLDQTLTGASIRAFEPHPATYAQLSGNIASNQTGANRIQTFNIGLGRESGELLFRDVDQFNSGNSILLAGSLAARASRSTTVEVRRLDDLPAPPDRIDLAKIDVEGFELDVLAGGRDTLKRTTAVLIEFNHWCLSSLAHILPINALEEICGIFGGVFVFDRVSKSYVRLASDGERWAFLHKNMVTNNVDDLLCTNSPSVMERLQKGA